MYHRHTDQQKGISSPETCPQYIKTVIYTTGAQATRQRKAAGLGVQLCVTLRPQDCSPPDTGPWDYPSKNTGVGCHLSPPGDVPNPDTDPASSALAGLFFTTESPGEPKERIVSPVNNVKKTGQPHARVILDDYLIPHTKINPK